MKGKKNPLGTKAQVRALKEREKRIATAIFLIFILSMVILSAYFAYTLLNPSPVQSSAGPTLQFKPENPNSQLKAAIVDEVSLTNPNQTFVQAATDILKHANYSIDYYSSEKVTVDLFRNLPTPGYDIIILRVHSGLSKGTQPPVSLATSEAYSTTEHVNEQLANQVNRGQLATDNRTLYFLICPSFVKSCMIGSFKNTVIIMMGCEGLTYTDMAEAFRERGAEAYISWKGSVSLSYSDQATILFLQHFVTERQTIGQAIEKTEEEVGLDLGYDNTLGCYPLESAKYEIPG
jgi:hypothetical protein